jgi:dCMP deaminase
MVKNKIVDTATTHLEANDIRCTHCTIESVTMGTTETSNTNHDVKHNNEIKTPGSKRFKVSHVQLNTDEDERNESHKQTTNVPCNSHGCDLRKNMLPSTVTPASDPAFTKETSPSTGSNKYIVSSTPFLPTTCPKAIESLLMDEIGYCSLNSKIVKKRSNYINWDDYFMAVATLSSYRSKDPHHPTGACIVDPFNRIIGTGYNGFPTACSDDVLPWADANTESTPWLHTKTPFLVHAEVNAILNKCSHDCAGARLFTQYFPCNECAKVIIQSRITEVVYVHETRCGPNRISKTNDDSLRASRILLSMANVRLRQYMPKCQHLHLKFHDTLDSNDCKLVRETLKTKEEQRYTSPSECNLMHRDLLWKEAKLDITSSVSMKRQDYLAWDDYFMSMAFLTAQRSKDPNTQVGACIVDRNKRIVGLGYNGFPSGCSDDTLPWSREASSELHKKYVYVCHAEVNAILNKGSADVRGGALYVALFPCNECSKVIIQAGIREVVYMSDRYHDTDSCRASRILLHMAGVKLRNYIPSMASVTIEMVKVIDTS